MIDFGTETTISLSDAARLLPRGRRGRPVSISCLLRWIITGARLPSGERVRLEGLRLGGRWVTSMQAIQRFAIRLTPQLDDTPTRAASKGPTTSRTPKKRDAASNRAERRLEAEG